MKGAADQLRVARLLRTVTDEAAFLAQENLASPSRRADPMWLRGVKYSFVVAVEAAVDVAQHVCATSGWGPPNDNGHAVRLLGEHGLLTSDLSERLSRAVGFRNVLVHDYAQVDDSIVVGRLSDLTDLTDFATAIARAVLPT